jgi:HSP20 family protein
MNRLLTGFFDPPTGRGAALHRRWVPALDLVETAEHYVLRADLPGLGDADVSVRLEDGLLTIAGERRTAHESDREGYMRLERPAGPFSRSVRLPEGIDAEAVTASFDRGVLEVRIPKPASHRPRTVAIAVGRPESRGS